MNTKKENSLANRILPLSFFLLGFAIVAILLFSAAITRPYMWDEESYISGAFFAMDYALYGDFVFFQLPYFAWIFGAVFKLVDSNFFLTARLLVFTLSLLSAALVYVLARKVSGSWLVGACAVALFMCSTVLNQAFGWARNDILAIFFTLSAALAFVASDRADTKYSILLKVLAGIAAGCAVGTRVTYIFLPAGLFLVEGARYLVNYSQDKNVKKLAGFAVGLVIAAIPVLLMAMLYPDGFFYGVYEHHIIGPTEWSAQLGQSHEIRIGPAVLDWLTYLRRDVSMGAAVFLGYGALHTLIHHSESFKHKYSINGNRALFLVLVVLAIPATLVARPVHVHYVQPLILVLIMAAVAHARATEADSALRQHFFLVMTLIVSIPGLAILAGNVNDRSAVEQMSRVTAEIRTALGNTQGPIASLSPVFVIDAGAKPYLEFSAGPFFYRSAHLLPADRVQALGGVSPETLSDLFASKPPGGVLVGYSGDRVDIDGGLKRYAEANGFKRVDIDNGNAQLYLSGEP